MINWKKIKSTIPHRVRIKNKIWYEVLYISDFKDQKTLGETRFETKQIVIKTGLSPKMTVSTFFHEVLHAISFEYDVDLTENQVLNIENSVSYLLPLVWDLNK